MSFNQIQIVGNLGRDVDLRYTPSGTAVANVNVATTEKRRDEEITTWFKCTLWGKLAENADKYLKKGSPVFLQGTLSVEEWEDREGNPRHSLVVNCDKMQFIAGGRRNDEDEYAGSDDDEAEEEAAPAPKAKKAAAAAAGSGKKSSGGKKAAKPAAAPGDDDIPF